MQAGTAYDAALRRIQEEPVDAGLPLFVHPGWRREFEWLAQGVTGRAGVAPYDLGLFGETATSIVQDRWLTLRRATGMQCTVHARQVHGARVLVHDQATPSGLLVLDDADGHATAAVGLLLTVSVADCVPVSLVDPERKVIALLHAGWRGVAAGILENGVGTLRETYGCAAGDLRIHLGPAICGECYEVGPDVHAALGIDRPSGPAPVDLRVILAMRAFGMGVSRDSLTVSGYCTLHDPVFHSHRGGARERQVAVLGVHAV